MPFHDLGDIGFCSDPIPDPFGIDHQAGTQFTMVKTAGLVGPNKTFEIESLGFAFEMGVKLFRS